MIAKTKLPFVATILIVLITAIDQIAKYWVVQKLNLFELGKIEISSIFDLTMVWNNGVSFGALRADSEMARWALVGLSAVISCVFLFWMFRATRKLNIFALAMVIGGAFGNMIDRIRFGAVADFLDFSGLYFPWVFNIADASVVLGASLLLLDMFINDEKLPAAPDQNLQNNNVE
ncbi:MAG: signal peptidase II [Pseudomonadota bacterium]